MLASRIKCLAISFVETSVVRHIVASMDIPVDVIINSEDIVASAKAIDTRLTTQTSSVKRIIFADIRNFLRKLSGNAQGIT